ncbi:FAD binding domain-containing protein [Scheffersomyces coipomensis]|uniref:FAD binding domain-containing protein n=1 Tax=Scheffersomyces coipomensis TaxID=1788519 RepID=UPI00315DF2CE
MLNNRMSYKTRESNVDVLIIGAGPAGHMAATWFARTGVNARIIDKRSARQFVGQADGLQSRSLEIFQSFGFADRALKESNHMLELCFWEPEQDASKGIKRSGAIPDTTIGLSRFQQVVIHQGTVEGWMRDSWKKWSDNTLVLERPVQAKELEIDQSVQSTDLKSFPVTVTVEHLDDDQAAVEQFGSKISNGLFRQFDGDGDKIVQGETEIIHAKYVLGTDGAHSWVRKQLGISMTGESTDYVWGVLDGIPVTDFPDIRCRCAIHSAENGSIMIIPREHNMIRLYIQLQKAPRANDSNSGRIDRSKITPELILENANKILYPYTIEMVDIKWYTAYQIGQRVATEFQKGGRVFLAGDATHTHSPKAGQGMNISMADTYNLSWKIAHVVKGLASPIILDTYESERKTVAENLIEFDSTIASLFSSRPAVNGKETPGVDLEEFHRVFEKSNEFTSGTTVDYNKSILIDKVDSGSRKFRYDEENIFTSPLAKRCPIGRRLGSSQVLVQSDSKPVYLEDIMPSDGRWRVLYFAGDIKNNEYLQNFMNLFGDYLNSQNNFVKKYTPATAKIYSVIEVLLVHASKRKAYEWNDFHTAFRPRDYKGRMDYLRIFSDDESYHHGHGHAYEKYGIDPSVGAFLVIRPDGHLAKVENLSEEGIANIEKYFSGFMIPQLVSLSNHQQIVVEKENKEWYGSHSYAVRALAE